jgi:hypothetical protein
MATTLVLFPMPKYISYIFRRKTKRNPLTFHRNVDVTGVYGSRGSVVDGALQVGRSRGRDAMI